MLRQELAHLPVFSGLSDSQFDLLAQHLEARAYAEDEIIFEQGQSADYLYILYNGEVEVRFKPYDGPPLTISRISPGGVFGWSASLGREAYTSAAFAICDCQIYRIRGADLHHLCEDYPETGTLLLEKLASVIAERLRNTHDQVLEILSIGVERSESERRIQKE